MLPAANLAPGGNFTANLSDILAGPDAPQYFVPFGPESINSAWYALPMDAYVVLGGSWNLLDVAQVPDATLVGQYVNVGHWCLPQEVSCAEQYKQKLDFELEHQGELSWQFQEPDDETSAPMLCYMGSQYYTDTFIRVETTDGITTYVPSRTSSGEQNVCASYSSRSRVNSDWTWHCRVMSSSACSSLAGAAAAAGSDAGSNVTHVTCCSTPYCKRPGELVWRLAPAAVHLALSWAATLTTFGHKTGYAALLIMPVNTDSTGLVGYLVACKCCTHMEKGIQLQSHV
jgi:hypothetical protein